MAYEKILEAANDALASKDYLLEAYRKENEKLKAKNAEMIALLKELQGGEKS